MKYVKPPRFFSLFNIRPVIADKGYMYTKRIAALFAVVALTAVSGAAQTGPTLVNGFLRQEGIASWYGTEFDGRPTASGESFNSALFTAAHPSLPFGTMLRVTNRHNNRQVVVKVNDRGPFVSARIIDLSQAAAQQLDMINTGTAPVLVESLEPMHLSSLPSAGGALTAVPESYGGASDGAAITSPAQITAPELTPLPPEDFPAISQNAPLSQSYPAPAPQAYPGQPVPQPYPAPVPQPAYPSQSAPQGYPAPAPSYPSQPAPQPYPAPAPQPAYPSQSAPQPYPAPTPQPAYPSQPPAASYPSQPAPQPYPAPTPQPAYPSQPPAASYPSQPAPQTYPAPTPQPSYPAQPTVVPEVAPIAPPPPPSTIIPTAPRPAVVPAAVPLPPAEISGVVPVLGSGKTYRIQVGAYRNPRNAADVFDKLKSVGLNAAYERLDNVYRVVLAGVAAEEVQAIAERLGMAGFPEALIREER